MLWQFIVYHSLFPRNVVQRLTHYHNETLSISVLQIYSKCQETKSEFQFDVNLSLLLFLGVCVTCYRFRWGLHNQWSGTTAWSVLLMPYCIHGYMKEDWQKQRGRSWLSGRLLFPDIPSLRSWLASRMRESERDAGKSCSLKMLENILFNAPKKYYLSFNPTQAERAGLYRLSPWLFFCSRA